MIDPVTAVSVATTAFTAIQKAVAAGKELEDIGSTLGRWAGAMSDINFLEQKSKNPPWYKSFSSTPEAEAIQIFAAKEKIEKQKKEILTMVSYMYGSKGKERYLEILREVKEQRRLHAYRKEELKEKIIEVIVGILAATTAVGIVALVIYFVGAKQGKW